MGATKRAKPKATSRKQSKAIKAASGGKRHADQLVMWQERYANLKASYDAASESTEYQKIWANADTYDADSANSREVRHKLIKRSRYEVGSNGYSDGIAQTYATDLVGLGPTLRMQTGSEGFNRLIETQWYLWTKAVALRRKLWCLAHAKHTDGEGFGIIRRNPGVKHPVSLDVCLYEADQIQTPYLPFGEPGYIDGVKFDEFGNPLWYELLKEHPGSTQGFGVSLQTERIPAENVLHWFKLRRPGQHRAVPECTSTLNTGAAARRWREATLAAAETAADFSVLLKTQHAPNSDELELAAAFSEQEISKRMMVALPDAYEPYQLKPEHPTAAYEAFHKALVNEQARPKSMPYNKAACDSSSYNYASGRLDHQTYYAALDVEREDCNDLVLDPLFNVWFDFAIRRFGWLGGVAESVGLGARAHIWDWPKHRVADIQAEAGANKTKLETGEDSLANLYASSGRDYEDDLLKDATANGITVEQQRQINMLRNLPQHVIPFVAQIVGLSTPAAPPSQPPTAAEQVAASFKRNGHANGVHVNGN